MKYVSKFSFAILLFAVSGAFAQERPSDFDLVSQGFKRQENGSYCRNWGAEWKCMVLHGTCVHDAGSPTKTCFSETGVKTIEPYKGNNRFVSNSKVWISPPDSSIQEKIDAYNQRNFERSVSKETADVMNNAWGTANSLKRFPN